MFNLRACVNGLYEFEVQFESYSDGLSFMFYRNSSDNVKGDLPSMFDVFHKGNWTFIELILLPYFSTYIKRRVLTMSNFRPMSLLFFATVPEHVFH